MLCTCHCVEDELLFWYILQLKVHNHIKQFSSYDDFSANFLPFSTPLEDHCYKDDTTLRSLYRRFSKYLRPN